MIDYDLPSGYQEESAINLGFMKMVMINETRTEGYKITHSTIVIAEMPKSGEIDEEEMRLQNQLSMKKSQCNQGYDMKLIDEQATTIRGQEVSLLTYEGIDEERKDRNE